MHCMIMKIEQWVLQAIEGEDYPFTRLLLRLISHFYAFLVWIRGKCFDWHLFRVRRAVLPVVSIGNIIAGGTGKTSFAMRLAQDVQNSPAIISRGYRSERKVRGRSKSRLVTDLSDGDEPYLMKTKLPFARAIVGPRREESALLAREVGARWIILDDGMQYRRLHRDIEVAMIHVDLPFGGGYYLPRGLLRESPKRLSKADYVVLQGVSSLEVFEKLSKELATYTKAPVIGAEYRIMNSAEIAGKKVGAFCGIGRPSHFFRMVEELGCEIVEQCILPDHTALPDPKAFVASALEKGAEIVVCSEKDWIKLDKQDCFDKQDRVVPLRVSLEILYGERHYAQLVAAMKIANSRI